MTSGDTARAPAPEQSARVLVVDDNEVNRDLIKRQIARLGHACDVVEDGSRALEALRGGNYTLLLTDLRMPVLDGYELARAVRLDADFAGRNLAIFAISADKESPARINEDFTGYLSKPIPRSRLAEILATYVDGPPCAVRGAEHARAESPQAPDCGAVFEGAVLQRLLGDDPAEIRYMLGEFMTMADAQVAALESAYDAGDPVLAGEIAHKLKSAAASVGCYVFSQQCAQIERAANDADFERLVDYREPCVNAYRQLVTAIDTYLEN